MLAATNISIKCTNRSEQLGNTYTFGCLLLAALLHYAMPSNHLWLLVFLLLVYGITHTHMKFNMWHNFSDWLRKSARRCHFWQIVQYVFHHFLHITQPIQCFPPFIHSLFSLSSIFQPSGPFLCAVLRSLTCSFLHFYLQFFLLMAVCRCFRSIYDCRGVSIFLQFHVGIALFR